MGKKVSFQITSLIKGSSTCGAFVWRFLFRFEASKGLILHKLAVLKYYCTFSYRNAHLEISVLDTTESSPGRTGDCLPRPVLPQKGYFIVLVRAFRASGAHGKRPPRRPPAPGLPRRAAGLPCSSAPAAAEAGLEPSTKNASKRWRGRSQTRGSLPAANRFPAGVKPVSRGRRSCAALPQPRR